MALFQLCRVLGSISPQGISVAYFDPGPMPGTGIAHDGSTTARAYWRHVLPRLVDTHNVGSLRRTACSDAGRRRIVCRGWLDRLCNSLFPFGRRDYRGGVATHRRLVVLIRASKLLYSAKDAKERHSGRESTACVELEHTDVAEDGVPQSMITPIGELVQDVAGGPGQ
jgi:hypothetical protein